MYVAGQVAGDTNSLSNPVFEVFFCENYDQLDSFFPPLWNSLWNSSKSV